VAHGARIGVFIGEGAENPVAPRGEANTLNQPLMAKSAIVKLGFCFIDLA